MLIFDQPLKKLYNQTTHRIDLKRFLPIKSNFLQKQNSHQIFGYQIWSIQLYNLKIAGEKWKTLDKSTLNLPTRLWLMVLRLGLRTFKYCKTGIFSKKKWDFFYSDINLEVQKIRSDDNHIYHSRFFEGNLIFFVEFIWFGKRFVFVKYLLNIG